MPLGSYNLSPSVRTYVSALNLLKLMHYWFYRENKIFAKDCKRYSLSIKFVILEKKHWLNKTMMICKV